MLSGITGEASRDDVTRYMISTFSQRYDVILGKILILFATIGTSVPINGFNNSPFFLRESGFYVMKTRSPSLDALEHNIIMSSIIFLMLLSNYILMANVELPALLVQLCSMLFHISSVLDSFLSQTLFISQSDCIRTGFMSFVGLTFQYFPTSGAVASSFFARYIATSAAWLCGSLVVCILTTALETACFPMMYLTRRYSKLSLAYRANKYRGSAIRSHINIIPRLIPNTNLMAK